MSSKLITFAFPSTIDLVDLLLSEYRKHVRQILQRLREFELQADIEKCEFYV